MDQQRGPRHFAPVPDSGVAGYRAKVFWLEHARQTIELRPGFVLIGRSSHCHIVVDDGMVSRRHAQLLVASDSVSVEDFGSVNGVYINSQRVRGKQILNDGDHLQIGTQEFLLRSRPAPSRTDSNSRLSADTIHAVQLPGDPTSRSMNPQSMPVESEATFSAHTLDLLGGVADKVLALGRGEEAEKVLATTLGNLLAEITSHRGSTAPLHVFEKAAHYAVRLADATGKGKWVDYAIDLFSALARPLPATTVNDLYDVLRKTSSINLAGFRAYLELLRQSQQSFGPSERFVLQRLEGLERLAALK
ncbi:MAG TPA: FHA domain-containing protein [Polyangiaceae bacterium]|nr:FHA domain-containing protein [Polyangiaceae bacterium]